MKISISISAILLVFLFYSCGSNNSDTNNGPDKATVATSETLSVVATGQRVYEQKCVACHGSDGAAGIANAANLHTSTLDSIAIMNTISKGRNGMPAFGSQLTPEEIKDVAGYVILLRK